MPAQFLLFLASALTVGVHIAIAFWEKILDWAMESFFPWLEDNLPELEEYARYAFMAFDAVATSLKKKIKQSWEYLRNYLLKQTIELERKTYIVWIKKTISWVIVKLKSGKPVAKKVQTEEEIPYDSLPEDVRRDYIKKGVRQKDINVTDIRDRDLETVTLEN